MLSKRRIVIGVPVLVICGIAGQSGFSSRIAGSFVSASWSVGPVGYVSASPVNTPEGRAYSVAWMGCEYLPGSPVQPGGPGSPGSHCLFAAGLVPRSAIREGNDALELDLDISTLSVVFTSQDIDCRSGPCITSFPQSIPLKGAFLIYSGPGFFSEHSEGSYRRDASAPIIPPVMFSESFSGNRARYSANFSGIVGPVVVVPPPVGSNANLSIMKGQLTSQTVYP